MDKAAELKRIADEIAEYPLYPTATKPVPGEDNPDAEIVFVGEAPGFHEDK